MSNVATAATAATAASESTAGGTEQADLLGALAASLGVTPAELAARISGDAAGNAPAPAAAAATAPAPVTPGGTPTPPAPANAAPAPTGPAAPPPPVLAAGNLVSHTWEDTYAPGTERTRYGIVVGVPAAAEGEPPTATIGWLADTATVPAALLVPVTGA